MSDRTTHAHHIMKATTLHHETRDQRNLLLDALELLLAVTPPVCSHPIGAPYSPARREWEGQSIAIAGAKKAIALVRGAQADTQG